MHTRILIGAAAFAAIAGTLSAQSYQRRAVMTGGGFPGGGQCQVEVMVDGSAQVDIRGDNAVLRNMSGQTPQWRVFECTGVMPTNVSNFELRDTQGRGDIELVRDPRNGGEAVVRIEDPESGPGIYRFRMVWNNGVPGGYRERNTWGENGNYRQQFTRQDALRACQDSVRTEAMNRFHTGNLEFKTSAQTNPERPDWITGTLQINGDYGRHDWYQFSCSVDYDAHRVYDTQIQAMDQPRGGYRSDSRAATNSPAVPACERAAAQRLRDQGYGGIQFGTVRVEDRPGGNDVVLGSMTAQGQYGTESFGYSCSVRLESGEVRSVDVTNR